MIVDYIDYTNGKSTNVTKEFPFNTSDIGQKLVKADIWEWKKQNGFKITRLQRYSSVENVTFDIVLGGE